MANSQADFSRSGRGAALLKVLEQPSVRKPGIQHSTPQTGISKDEGTVPMVPRGRGFFGMPPPPRATPSQPTSPALSGVTGSQPPVSFGRGLFQHAKAYTPLSPPLSQQSSQHLSPIDTPIPVSVLSPPLSQLSLEQKQGEHLSSTSPSQSITGHSQTAVAAPRQSTSPKSMPPSSSGPLVTEKMKKGTSGNTVPLGVNYLALQASSETVYQYAVSFSPPIESRNMRYAMLNQQSDLIGDTKAFDGATLFLPKKITDTSATRTAVRQTDGVEISITITLTNVMRFNDCMQLFNIIIRRILRSLDLHQVGRQYYDQHHSIQVPQHKMELWPGYVTAVHEFDGGLLLLLDVSHKLLRMDTALDFLYELYHTNKNNFQEEAMRQVVGTVVVTRYNNRTYRVDDIAWDKNPMSTFTDHTGKSVSFVEYYRTAYSKSIEDTEQPLLLHRPRQKRIPRKAGETVEQAEQVICLVPELCSMTGLTDQARNDFKVMKDLATYTRLTPLERERSFRKFVDSVNTNPKSRKELESWGLRLHPTMLITDGRRLPIEKILFKDKSVLAGSDADWGKHIVKENVISAVPLNNWVLVFCKRDSPRAMDFVSTLKKVTPMMGIKVNDPIVLELPNDRTDTYIRAIREQVKPSLQIVVVIFPSQRDDRYSSIKKLCCVENPVPSQVINSRTISQPQKIRSVTQKIALQMNCKMGGELWALDIPLKNVMVVGIDVYHDSSAGKRSVLGLVTSTNRHMTRWYSRVFIQDKNQEIADALRVGFHSALTKYHEVNQTLPDRIIVFRDGVGDGQMFTVVEFEVPQIKKCFQMFGEGYKPKMAVVVVQKRISTRIFGKGSNGYDNPPPGTIIDHTITRKGWYDFFLVSQHVRQGTVTPTHYNIVTDSTNLAPDHMQRLTYKLTHLYYNWPGTVRVPAPCQYAHKLAFLVGQSLHRAPSLDICDRLFFL